MTRDDVIRMALKVGLVADLWNKRPRKSPEIEQ